MKPVHRMILPISLCLLVLGVILLAGTPAMAVTTRDTLTVANVGVGHSAGASAHYLQATLPALSINDVSLVEGNAGTTTFTFTVSLSSPAPPGGVTFDIATANNTATTSNNDYVAQSLTGQTIPAGSSTYAFNITVSSDLVAESNETFFVNVTNVTGANVVDGQGTGTILNDDIPATQTLIPTQTLTPTHILTRTPQQPRRTSTPVPPPPTPSCEAFNDMPVSSLRATIANGLGYDVFCRMIYENGSPAPALGDPVIAAATIGVVEVLNAGVQQAVDIYSPSGLNRFDGGATFCLYGQGTLVFLAASGIPRVAQTVPAYELEAYPGYLCATLYEAGTLVLVTNPL